MTYANIGLSFYFVFFKDATIFRINSTEDENTSVRAF